MDTQLPAPEPIQPPVPLSTQPPAPIQPLAPGAIQPPDFQQYPAATAPPERSPKKQLRRDIMVIVLTLIGMFIAGNLVALIAMSIILMFTPEFQSMMSQAVNSGTVDMQALLGSAELNQLEADLNEKYTGLLMLLAALATLCGALIIRGTKVFTHDLVVVNQKIKLTSIAKLFVLVLGVGSVVSLFDLALDPLLKQLGLSLTEFLEGSLSQAFASPIGLLYVMILGPIIEEIVFRGALLNRLARHGFNFAIVFQALIFGLFHGVLYQAFGAFFVGILLGYVALRYSLKWAMLLHILNNSISVGFWMLQQTGIGVAFDILNWSFVGVFAVAALIIVIIKRKQFSVTRQSGLPITPGPFRIAFTSPFMIVFVVFFLGIGAFTTAMPAILAGAPPAGMT